MINIFGAINSDFSIVTIGVTTHFIKI